jgi:hypothetical protein
MNLQPGYVYTLTTTTGQSKGSAASSGGASSLRLPYSENFDSYQPGVTPTYVASMGGAFETEPCIAGPAPAGPASSGMCLQQQITSQPVTWWGVDNKPMVVAGDPSWRDYRASIDALMERPGGYVELVGRALGPSNGLTGYHFQINTQGQWSLYREDSTGFDNPGADTTLASGTTTVFGEYTWHQLSIDVAGDQISPYLDGHLLTTVTDNTYQMGQVGLEVSPWLQAQFDNLQVQPEKVPSQDKAPQLSQPNSTAVQMPDPGASRQVGTTLAAPATATAVSARMQAPQGWSAEAVNSAPARLSAGQAAPLAWRLTAPANAARGLYQAEIIVTYESAGRSWTSTSRVPVYLGLQPSPALAHTPMKP